MTKIEKQTSSKYTFNELNQDLNDLYEIMKQENLKKDEMERLLDPILSKIPYDQRKSSSIFIPGDKILLIIFSMIMVVHFLTYWDRFYWNLTALVRIPMIKILPYYDWRYLKNEMCLIPKLFGQKTTLQIEEIFNCDLCESLTSFDQFTYDLDQNIENLIYTFVDVDRPIIVNGGIDHWIKESPVKFIDQLIEEKELARSIPCKVSTNVHNLRKNDLDFITLIKKSGYFENFFMHFQNCELIPMKIFRKHTYRPKILPAELSPVTYNWLLWNKNYNSNNFKKIDLVERYAVIGQIFGKTRLNLIPRKNCGKLCANVEGVLPAGHFMVLTSLWDVEYMPAGEGENVAVILEIK